MLDVPYLELRGVNRTRFAQDTACCIFLIFSLCMPHVARAQTATAEWRVEFSAGREIFPASWLDASVNARAEPLADQHRAGRKNRVQIALQKYPAAVVQENLSAIFVLGKLSFSGIQASGTNSRDRIFVASGDDEQTYSEDWFERVVHSEFSSILLRKHPQHFHHSAWLSANPPGFDYGGDGVKAVKNRQFGRLFDEQYLSKGFLGLYSHSSIENDFNAFAGQLMMGEQRLWAAAAQHGAIQIKLQLAIDFYRGVNASMDAAFFEDLADANSPASSR